MPLVVLQSIAFFQQVIKELLSEIETQRQLIKEMTIRDQLTGLLLLNMATERLEKAISRTKRSNNKAALFFID